MLQVQCPKCGKKQLYDPKPGMVSAKSKRCVYCGATFKVRSNQKSSRITRILK